jgi:hypothetical protein
MPETLDKIAREFRSAILAGEHELAGRLVSAYADAARNVWESLPEAERQTSQIPSVAGELLTWARGMTVVQRSIAAEQLAVLQKTSGYVPQCLTTPRSTIQVSF